MTHDITSDGITVWVNGETHCLARFGVFGIDIHTLPAETRQECLFCTHKRTTQDDWKLFVTKMKEFYGIDVKDTYLPKRFRERSRTDQDKVGGL